MRKEERIHSIDFLKGICILFVIITHSNFTDYQRLIFGFPFWIKMAVPIFMIMSGYTMYTSYEKHTGGGIKL